MSFYQTVLEQIDMRSFSNLWFWIALAVMWTMASHSVLGIPYDMLVRARRVGGASANDLDTMARLRVARLTAVANAAGAWLVACIAFVLTMLAILGFRYDVELAQAVFLLAMPMSMVTALRFSTARRIAADGLRGSALRTCLERHRRTVQAIGIVSIFVTALWGMYRNLALGPLGG